MSDIEYLEKNNDIEGLVNILKDKNDKEIVKSLHTLCRLNAKDATPYILELLKHKMIVIRKEAVIALSISALSDEELIKL